MQTAYNAEPNVAFAGMPADGHHLDADSGFALENLDFGRGAFRCDDAAKPRTVRVPRRNAPTIVLSADLVTSNVVNGNVNGVALAPITFATDHLTTITALADAIVAALLLQGIVATYALSGTNRTITFTATDASILFANFAVTAGGSQATVTLAHPTSDAMIDFVGVVRHSPIPPRISDGVAGFSAKDSVALVRKGRIWVVITSDVADNADAYVDVTSGNEGKFTDVSSGNIGPVGKFRGIATVAGLGLAILEVNLP